MERDFQENGHKKQTGVAILIFNKIYFKPKLIRRDGEGHFIFIKGKIHQDGTFSKSDHTFGHKASINRYKNSGVLSDYHVLKLNFNNKTTESLQTHGNRITCNWIATASRKK